MRLPHDTVPLYHRAVVDETGPADVYVFGGRVGVIRRGDDWLTFDFHHPAAGYHWFQDRTGAYPDYRPAYAHGVLSWHPRTEGE